MSLAVLNPGDSVGEYRLEAPLGRGGFGQVWRAVHRHWEDRVVALKIPTETDAIRRLTKEAVLQSSLDHPGIARAIGLDAMSDPPYIAMEYVEGESLRELLDRERRVEPERARALLLELVAVLEHAHGRGVVHQDIKPENLLITVDGRLKVTDFGLGTSAASDSLLLSYSLRSEESFGGTLAYMAPEVRDGEPEIDARADLYSTGVVLFEMVTGRRPAGRELPSDLVSGLPRWCDHVFEKLYTRRGRRAASASAVAAMLSAFPAHDVVTEPPRRPRAQVTPLKPPTLPTFSRGEARRILGLVDSDLDAHIASGRIRAHRVAGETRIAVADVQELRRHRDRRPEPPPASPRCGRRASQPPPEPRGSSRSSRRAVARVARARRRHSVRRLEGDRRPAGFWIRAVAMAIDLWLIAMLQTAIGVPFLFIAGFFLPQFVLLAFLYFTIGACQGQTIGKWCVGIRVVASDGQPPSIFEGVARTLLYGLSAVPFGLGFVVAGWNRNRRALHDLASGTRVVHVGREVRSEVAAAEEEFPYRSAI